MEHRLLTVIVCAAIGLSLAGCAVNQSSRHDGRYTSPDGSVSFSLPALLGGGRLQEHHDASYFGVILTDDTGALYRAEGYHPPLPPGFAGKSTNSCTRVALDQALAVIRSVCPNARIARSRFDPDLLGGAMIATVRMPAGSVAMAQRNNGPWRRTDSQRVLVIFKVEGALITVSHHGGDLPALTDNRQRQREIDAGDERRAIHFAREVRYHPRPQKPAS